MSPTRTAGLLMTCAVLCAALAMGLRQSFGLFLAPITNDLGWSASGFALAIACQVLVNGLAQPFAGLVMGVAVSAAGMPVIIASLTRLLPEAQRGRAVGLGAAGSSFGQFLVVPLAQLGINWAGWQGAMLLLAGAALLMIPLALPLNDRPAPANAAQPEQTARAVRKLGT